MRFSACLLPLFAVASLLAQQPAAPRELPMPTSTEVLPLWPNGTPEPSKLTGPEYDPSRPTDANVGGIKTVRVTNISQPSLAWFPATGRGSASANGTAVVVFPGGGYVRLAYNEEGTEVCQWLNSLGAGCVLVKYRVPEVGRFPENPEDLEDAQQAMRITREHAAAWHLDPHKLGVLGGSAGGHLAIVLSTNPDYQGKTVPASTLSARPDFQILLYPAYLNDAQGHLIPSVTPTAVIPPTFLVMAENDYTAHVESALTYYQGLKNAKVPAEMHLYAEGGHGFGLRPTGLPEAGWPKLAEMWMRALGFLPADPVR